ncbi:MAG TPA: fatty acid--CoA ligase family protein [Verrucomicrobiota bacterium]|nr:fatty acid--CoA ligase family protein [Verrucomicrobiota bacterium]
MANSVNLNAMLEQRWRNTVRERGNDLALSQPATGETWTFQQLAEAADGVAEPDEPGLSFPVGHNVGFILTVLRAWRSGTPICPLEVGQPAPAIPRPPPKIAHLKLTSGTTGAARCVAFTASQLGADADAIVTTMGLDPKFPNLGVISLAHSYGFSNLILPLLLHGIPLFLVPSPLPGALARVVAAYPLIHFTLPAVPALWRAWHEAGVIPRNLHRAISAGAPLPLPLEEAVFERVGVKLHNFLGSSECGGIAYDSTESPRTDARIAGTPLHQVKLTRAADGCLEVRSPGVGEDYWPEAEASLQGGLFRTPDLVELSAGGEVLLLGRSVDVINVAGRKVLPDTIESALRLHPEIRDCLVLGLPAEESRGEIIAAVFEAATPLSHDQLTTFLQRRLPAWQMPRRWRQVESLSPSDRGKLSRRAWRERLIDEKTRVTTGG